MDNLSYGETVTIPAEINGQKVLALGLPGATNHIPGAEKIGALDLSQTGVKVIEQCAFCFCPNIKGKIESATVEKIGDLAFAFCDGITSVNFSSCSTVGGSAFFMNTRLTDVTLQQGCSIGENAFSGVPAVIFEIKPYTYILSNTALTKGVTITNFINVTEGQTVTIPAEINGEKVLALGQRGATSHIPGAEKIGALDLSQTGVKVIEDYAFYGCSNLKGTIESDTVEKVCNYAFGGEGYDKAPQIKEVRLPACDWLNLAFDYCTNLETVILSDEIDMICDLCFRRCVLLKTVTTQSHLDENGNPIVPGVCLSNVTTIGGRAFEFCYGLTSVYAPNCGNVKVYAFRCCPNLKDVTLKKGCSIGLEAFYNCPCNGKIKYR